MFADNDSVNTVPTVSFKLFGAIDVSTITDGMRICAILHRLDISSNYTMAVSFAWTA